MDDYLLSDEQPFCSPVECRILGELRNGEVYLSTTLLVPNYGTSARFACKEGYILNGLEEITCIFDGSWSGEMPTCESIECTKTPLDIADGLVIGSSLKYKASLIYECNTGYFLEGEKSRTCLASGQWDKPEPECRPVECSPPRLLFGVVSTVDNTFGTVVKYSCHGKYYLEGPKERTCLGDGQWSDSQPQCLEIRCDVPIQVDHASGTILNHTTALYECERGYEIHGSAYIFCDNDSLWRPEPPKCVPVYCVDLSGNEFTNGHIKYTGAKLGDFVEYECDTGYILIGNSGKTHRQCLSSQKWSGQEPSCQKVTCGHPGLLDHGTIVGEDETFNATVYFECDPGFMIGEVKSIRCLETGHWENLYPLCKEVECPKLDQIIPDGYVRVYSYKPGGQAIYSCDQGFRLEGHFSRNCQDDGNWSGKDPICIKVYCPQPEKVDGIMTGYKDVYEIGDKVSYQCEPGYYIIGNNIRYCTESSRWTEPVPTCSIIFCPELPALENGFTFGNSVDYNSIITYSCIDGYELVGDKESTCLENGTWSGTQRSCVRIICGEPPSIENAFISRQDGMHYGDAVVYSCNVGYDQSSGKRKSLCQNDRSWSTVDFTCNIISCYPISANDVPHAVFKEGEFTYGTILNFSCEVGYELSGSSILICTESRLWSDAYPQCTIVTCSPLPSIEFGTLTARSNVYDSQATISCDIGRTLIGSSNISCLASGDWEDISSVCQIVSCEEIKLSDISNGIFIGSSFTYGSKVSFVCNEGYTLSGASEINCTADGSWNSSFPMCEIVVCPQLPLLESGQVQVDSNEYMSKVRFSCNEGYSLIGEENATCTSTGKWDVALPLCQIVLCASINLSDIPNGSFNGDQFTFGSVVVFQCNVGYKLSSISQIMCQADGTWNDTYPTCNIVTCPEVKELAFGRILGDDRQYGSVLRLDCDIGYSMFGPEKIACLETGEWDQSWPICLINSCPPITDFDFKNGVVNATTFTYQSLVYFTCYEGYTLEGTSNTLKCRANGTWDAYLPNCNIVKCPKLQQLPSGFVDSPSNEFGQTAYFFCEKGFELIGSESIECMSSGNWTSNIPVCEKKSCGHPRKIENGEFTNNNETIYYGETVVYSCNFGFSLVGVNALTCTDDGSFDMLAPICSRIPCPPLKNIEFGVMTSVNESYISFECISGYYLDGESQLECLLGGSWSISPPRCFPVSCPIPAEISNGRFTGEYFSFGNSINYTCNEGYSLNGISELSCQDKGNWSAEEPACTPISCGTPDKMENGYFTGDVYKFKNTVEYFCNDGFGLEGESNRTCHADGTWKPDTPHCVRLSCPAPNIIENGYTTGKDYYFESVITHTCNDGYRIFGDDTQRCVSSLTWSGHGPVCERMPCPKPFPVHNGIIDGDSFLFGDDISITCNIGYELIGTANRVCQPDGNWSGDAPTCDEIFCPTPPTCEHCFLFEDIEKSGVEFPVNSSVKYRCEDGYEFKDTIETICYASGQWSNIVECIPISCKAIPMVENGYVVYDKPTNPYVYQSVARFSCLEGFQINGNDAITCTAFKQWSHHFPECLIKRCPILQLQNGYLEVSSQSSLFNETERVNGQYVAGDIIEFKCNIGYRLSGSDKTGCSLNGTWPDYSSSCIRVPCVVPTIRDAFLSSNLALFGDVITVTCEKGLDLIGDDELKCTANGTWAEELPRCVLLTCGSPPFVDHAVLKGDSDFQQGDMAVYECKLGYEMIGNSIITCGPENQWLGSPPICTKVDCGIPNAFDNSLIQFNSTTYNSKGMIVCEPGFTIEGPAMVKCEADRKWIFDDLSQCVPRDCGLPPTIDHGTYDSYGTTFGSVVFYICDKGYFNLGSSSLECNEQGDWVDRYPVCSPVDCLEPPTIAHAAHMTNSTLYNGLARYTCDPGFWFEKKDITTLTCTDMGLWAEDYPICTVVECGPPPVKELSFFKTSNEGYQYLNKAIYTCEPGYESENITELVCSQSGLWKGKSYTCVKKNCFDYPALINGQYVGNGNTLFGSTAIITCFKGYRLVGPEAILCQEDGEWSSKDHQCMAVDCGIPSRLENGDTTFTTTHYLSVIEYSCLKGYFMVGSSKSECLDTGKWSHHGTCQPVVCKNPPDIDHGRASVFDTVYQSIAVYICQTGYIFNKSNDNSLRCSEDGHWEGEIPVCELVHCRDPAEVPFANMKYPGTMYLSTVNYQCHSGYTMKGSKALTCQENGTWTNEEPQCVPVDCSLPPNIIHGKVSANGTTFGAVAEYTCNRGFVKEEKGSDIITCDEYGSWNASAPTCNPVDCKLPRRIENARLEFTTTTFGSIASYTCDVGFNIRGNSTDICLENGKWSREDDDRYCEIIDCGSPPAIDNGLVDNKDTFFGADARYTCLSGFKPEQEAVLFCGETGQWEGERLTCSQITCHRSLIIQNGNIHIEDGDILPGTVAKYICHLGFSMVGKNSVICLENGTWSDVPTCIPLKCPAPPIFPNAQLIISPLYDQGYQSMISYRCEDGYRMSVYTSLIVRKVTATCTATSTWQLEYPFLCELITCPSTVPVIENGIGIVLGNLYLDTAEYRCDFGYVMEGNRNLICDVNGQWSSVSQSLTSCKKISCGSPVQVENGFTQGHELDFQSRVTYHCRTGFKLVGSKTITCKFDGQWSSSDTKCVGELLSLLLINQIS